MSDEGYKLVRDYEDAVARIILYCCNLRPLDENILVDLWLGSKFTDFVTENNLYQIPIYGIFASFSWERLITIINVLIRHDLLVRTLGNDEWKDGGWTIEHILTITPKGQEFLQGKLKIEIPFVEYLRNKDVTVLGEKDQRLYDELSALRKHCADQRRLERYMVCNNNTLKEIAKLKPTTIDKLSRIHGVGEKFIERYADAFLDVIQQFINQT